jgi:hypothetical protein
VDSEGAGGGVNKQKIGKGAANVDPDPDIWSASSCRCHRVPFSVALIADRV